MKRLYHMYRNLNSNCWSLKHRGKVIGHHKAIVLNNCEFRVSKKGRQRVLKEKVKNVHAYVAAESYEQLNDHHNGVERVKLTYNPYKYSTFVVKETGEPIHNCDTVIAEEDGSIYKICY